MLPILELLSTLQETDSRLAALRAEARELPARKQRIEERVGQMADRLRQAHDAQKKALSAIHQAEMDVEAAKEKVARLRRQQFEIKSNEQYRALQKEIEAELAAIRGIEDREIESMEALEDAQKKAAAAEREAAALEAEAAAEREALDRRAETLRSDMAGAEAERRSRAGALDPAWLDRYNRLLAHVGPPVVVPVVRDTCGGCHMRIPPQGVQDTKRGQTVCTCTFCNRMLYWDG